VVSDLRGGGSRVFPPVSASFPVRGRRGEGGRERKKQDSSLGSSARSEYCAWKDGVRRHGQINRKVSAEVGGRGEGGREGRDE